MFKKEKVEEVKSLYPVNENIINIISPSGIDFDDLSTSLGENVGKLYAITKYPFKVDYGWLAPLCNLDGTSTIIEFHHTDPARMIKNYDKRISELKSEHDTLKNESDKKINEKAVEDLKRLVKQVSVEEVPVGYVNIMLHVQNTNREFLEERIKKVSSAVSICGCNKKLLKYRQGIGLRAIAPYGIPDERVSSIGLRNMPLSTFLGGFPMANPGLNDEGGYYLGKTSNNRLVIVNQWLRNKDRTNSNWFIQGPPGIGKSTALKKLFTYEFAFGTKIIVFDPEEEYLDLANDRDIKGDVINCAGGEKGRINPLQARKTAVVSKSDLTLDESIDEFMEFEDDKSDLALYIQQLRVFFKLYFGKEEFTSGIKAVLEESLIELYSDYHIDWDTDVSTIPNDKWPIMSELYDKVKEKGEEKGISDYRKENCERLKDLLFSAGQGADKLWNGHTTLESDADFIDLVISDLLEADDNVKRAQFYNIMSFAWVMLSRNRSEKVLFGIDEGYLVVDPEYPDLMKYIRNISKRLRKYEGGLMFITHSVVDVLDPSVKRYGQAIIDNACYKFIMGCDGKNLEETSKLFSLSEKEVNILSRKNRGQGIFFAGNVRLDLKVDVSDALLERFGNRGGR